MPDFGQPRRQRAAAGARADDHVVPVELASAIGHERVARQNVFRNAISARLSSSLSSGSRAERLLVGAQARPAG